METPDVRQRTIDEGFRKAIGSIVDGCHKAVMLGRENRDGDTTTQQSQMLTQDEFNMHVKALLMGCYAMGVLTSGKPPVFKVN